MPLTIPDDLSAKTLDGIMFHVRRTNADQGLDLTLEQWVELHLKEFAIGEELAKTLPAIQNAANADAQATLDGAVRAERERLIRTLDTP